jgi:signal transduction histidine kinase
MSGGKFGMVLPSIAASRPSRSRAARDAAIEEDIKRLLARELHDRVAQTLTSMLVDLENFKTDQTGRQSVIRQMDDLQDSTRLVLTNLRQLLYELRGQEPVGDCFEDAIAGLVARFQAKTRISAELSVLPGWPKRMGSACALNLYRIVEEALSNVRMHSGAQQVTIVLQPVSETELAVVVRDDGRGVDTNEERPLGMGTVGMRERAMLLGGQLRIESDLGSGTTVRTVFPRDLSILADVMKLKEISA